MISSIIRRLKEFFGLKPEGPLPELVQISKLSRRFDDVLAQGDQSAAESTFRELREFVGRLKDQSQRLDVQTALASGHYHLAIAADRLGDMAAAESMYDQAREWLRPLRQQSKYQKKANSLYAACENMQGLMYLSQKMFAQASVRFESAIEHRMEYQRCAADDQENEVYLAGAMINLAHVHRECDRHDEARRGYTRAIDLLNRACPECECGCREVLIDALNQMGASLHWVLQSDQFREVAHWGLSQLDSTPPVSDN